MKDAELLRHAVLECLVLRHPNALPLEGVVRKVNTMLPFKVATEAVNGALELLAGLGLVRSHEDELGSSKWWTATSQGVLKVERE
jgi:hypothetical protein